VGKVLRGGPELELINYVTVWMTDWLTDYLPKPLHRPDDAGSKHLWNVFKLSSDYKPIQPRRRPSS
jgi:hypothetical protein